ncbi:MAG: hypothetical protein ABIB04_00075 [Patescibacteria group bacterium]
MDRFSKLAAILLQKAVDKFKALMEAEFEVRLSDDEARERAGHFLTVMKHAFYLDQMLGTRRSAKDDPVDSS